MPLWWLRPLPDYSWYVSFPDKLRPSEERQFPPTGPLLFPEPGRAESPSG